MVGSRNRLQMLTILTWPSRSQLCPRQGEQASLLFTVLSSADSLLYPQVDYSDLYDIMTFFHGTPEGHGSHDDLAQKIGLAGKNWARDHWRKQDMAAYMCKSALRPLVWLVAEIDSRTVLQSDSSSSGHACSTAMITTGSPSTLSTDKSRIVSVSIVAFRASSFPPSQTLSRSLRASLAQHLLKRTREHGYSPIETAQTGYGNARDG